MQLPAFFGHRRSINLLPRDDFESSTIGIILSWALAFGKWAVILTQLVVMSTFLWRFGLDRRLTDQRKEIAKQVAIIKSYEQIERDYALAQKQLATIKQASSEQEKILGALNEIERITPSTVWYDRITITPNDLTLSAYASTLPGFGQIMQRVQNNPVFPQVRVGKIESSSTRGAQLQFDLTLGLVGGKQ